MPSRNTPFYPFGLSQLVWRRALRCTSTPKRWIIRVWMSSQDEVDREPKKNKGLKITLWTGCSGIVEIPTKKNSWNRRHLDLTDSDSPGEESRGAGCNFVCNPSESMAAWDTLARAKVKSQRNGDPFRVDPFHVLGLWSEGCWKVLKFVGILEVCGYLMFDELNFDSYDWSKLSMILKINFLFLQKHMNDQNTENSNLNIQTCENKTDYFNPHDMCRSRSFCFAFD